MLIKRILREQMNFRIVQIKWDLISYNRNKCKTKITFLLIIHLLQLVFKIVGKLKIVEKIPEIRNKNNLNKKIILNQEKARLLTIQIQAKKRIKEWAILEICQDSKTIMYLKLTMLILTLMNLMKKMIQSTIRNKIKVNIQMLKNILMILIMNKKMDLKLKSRDLRHKLNKR